MPAKLRLHAAPATRLSLAVILALAVAGSVAAATASVVMMAPADATVHGVDGRIAFRQYFDGAHTHGAIFTIDPDGTGLHQVTSPPQGVLDTEPDWSPNGAWIAYERMGGAPSGLFRIRANGTQRRNLTAAHCPHKRCDGEFWPHWSPSGNRITFVRILPHGRGHHVMVMRADGTHRRRVTSPPGSRYAENCPDWSPDGDRLVFFARKAEVRCLDHGGDYLPPQRPSARSRARRSGRSRRTRGWLDDRRLPRLPDRGRAQADQVRAGADAADSALRTKAPAYVPPRGLLPILDPSEAPSGGRYL